MITGFNTDVEYEGVTYHVQTEDKGLSRPIILSLVYDGGTILASKRSPYNDLLGESFDEKLLVARLNKQHKLICAAIRAGRIDDLRRMSERDSAAADVSGAVAQHTAKAFESAQNPTSGESGIPIPKPSFDSLPAPLPDSTEIITATDVSIFEELEVLLLPDDAVEIISEMEGCERPSHDNLSVEFLGEAKFRGGERKSFALMVCRGTARKVVANAQVMVKILGSSFRPLIFHSATDANGIANLNLDLPRFNSGRAALLVRAMSEGEEVELRRVIEHG